MCVAPIVLVSIFVIASLHELEFVYKPWQKAITEIVISPHCVVGAEQSLTGVTANYINSAYDVITDQYNDLYEVI